jgi:hypothetical protein
VQDIKYTVLNILTAANNLNITAKGNLRGKLINNKLIEVS